MDCLTLSHPLHFVFHKKLAALSKKQSSAKDGNEQQCDRMHKLRGGDPLNPNHRRRNLAFKRGSRFLRPVPAMARHHPRSPHPRRGPRRFHRSLLQSLVAPHRLPRCHARPRHTLSVFGRFCLHGYSSGTRQH